MEEKKRYKATDVNIDGPFQGWIIEELVGDEYEKAEAAEREKSAAGGKTPANKLTPEEMEKKRAAQINKIKDLINQKKKAREEEKKQDSSKNDTTSNNNTNTNINSNSNNKSSNISDNNEEMTEEMYERKALETGIPVEVLKMIEEKKKMLRERKTKINNNPKGGEPEGKEIADSIEEKIIRDEKEREYAEREGRDGGYNER